MACRDDSRIANRGRGKPGQIGILMDSRHRSGDMRGVDHGFLQVLAVEDLAARTSHERTGSCVGIRWPLFNIAYLRSVQCVEICQSHRHHPGKYKFRDQNRRSQRFSGQQRGVLSDCRCQERSENLRHRAKRQNIYASDFLHCERSKREREKIGELSLRQCK